MTDLRERMPAEAVMKKFVSLAGTDELRELPFGLIYPTPDAVSWMRGTYGELEVAERLTKLGDRWVVLHSVPVGDRGSDIDHIVIGPPGVFVLNTKRMRDRVVPSTETRYVSTDARSDGCATRRSRLTARRRCCAAQASTHRSSP